MDTRAAQREAQLALGAPSRARGETRFVPHFRLFYRILRIRELLDLPYCDPARKGLTESTCPLFVELGALFTKSAVVTPSTKTNPLWSLTRHVVRGVVADHAYQLTMRADQDWLQMTCARLPVRGDELTGVKLRKVAITALVNFPVSKSDAVLRQHLVRKNLFFCAMFWVILKNLKISEAREKSQKLATRASQRS